MNLAGVWIMAIRFIAIEPKGAPVVAGFCAGTATTASVGAHTASAARSPLITRRLTFMISSKLALSSGTECCLLFVFRPPSSTEAMAIDPGHSLDRRRDPCCRLGPTAQSRPRSSPRSRSQDPQAADPRKKRSRCRWETKRA